MKNNNAPFHPNQRVVCIIDKFGYTEPGAPNEVVKDGVYTVSRTFIGKLVNGGLAWGVVLEEVAGSYEAAAFAPIREVRDHKKVAVPEELLHVVERDTLEPVKVKV